MLLHGLQQGRLRLRRGPVDLVGEHDVREDRPRPEHHLLPIRGLVLLQDLRSRDVGGHEVRRELDPGEVQVQHLGHDVDDHRLRQPRNSEDQAVPTHVQ